MTERRAHRERWRPGHRSPGFLVFLIVLTILTSLISTCAQASPTDDEKAAYRVGIVSGAYYSYLRTLLARLVRAGVQQEDLARVVIAGCSGATIRDVSEAVLLREPIPKSEAEIVSQTWIVMDGVCSSLQVTGA